MFVSALSIRHFPFALALSATVAALLAIAASQFALQAVEKLYAEGGGGFNPRMMQTESTRALAPEKQVIAARERDN